MTQLDRRSFLKGLAAAVSLTFLSGRITATNSTDPYEILVIGDSMIWGQGLEETTKFYRLTADWLRDEVFEGRRKVNLTVKAHSGATIKPVPKELEKLIRAKMDEKQPYPGEVTLSSPSMWSQVETADEEYERAGVSGADLVLLTAGITDIAVEGLLNPLHSTESVRRLIKESCNARVGELLAHIAGKNPDALIVATGYFPILSPKAKHSKLMNSMLEAINIPGIFKPILNNPVTRGLIFNSVIKKMIRHSRIWITESNTELQAAVNSFNRTAGRQQAIFVRSSLTEADAFEMPDTKLFRMNKKGHTNDPLFEQRGRECTTVLKELKQKADIKVNVNRCKIAAIGHPDAAGARAYFNDIKSALAPLIKP
ncbi:MAG: hypothetical protein IT172_04860 [Acidobacteria bacterium]|nr:hypothetical protein [Acidobacteriota bacterium]